MTPIHYGLFHTFIQNLAATRPGSWLLARVLYRLDEFVLRISRRRWTLTGLLAGVPVMMVTTTGARSGLRRTVPLLPVHEAGDAGRFALIASNWGQKHAPAWYFNLKKNPRAECQVDGRTGAYLAHEAAGDEYARFWEAAVDTYFGYRLYKQRAGRTIPILVMEKA